MLENQSAAKGDLAAVVMGSVPRRESPRNLRWMLCRLERARSHHGGRHRRSLRPPGEGFVLGIDVGGTKLALSTADLDGNRLLADELPTLADQGAPAVISRLLDAARGLVTKTSGAGGGELAAVGAGSPGIVLANGVLLAPDNPGWGTLALAAELRAGLSIDRVTVDTDAKAAVLAEARWGHAGRCGLRRPPQCRPP